LISSEHGSTENKCPLDHCEEVEAVEMTHHNRAGRRLLTVMAAALIVAIAVMVIMV
jgi:hypothetical protein